MSRYVRDSWKRFDESVLSEVKSESQRYSMKIAFFAGLSTYQSMVDVVQQMKTPEAGKVMFGEIREELTRFAAECAERFREELEKEEAEA